MRSLQLGGLVTALGLSLLLPACSSSGGGSTGPMFVETCSLGCSNGQGGTQVSCSIVNVGRNVEIAVLFSEEVDLGSVTSGSFRIINTTNGSVPVGTYSIDPVNPRRLIFRPALTFDAVGNPQYALDPDETYQITIPGQAQGDNGPFVQSKGARVNQSRLLCTIRTTEPLLDPVPGPPVQHTTIQVRKLATEEIVEVYDPANGATNVPTSGPTSGQQTVLRVVFDDIMNPATLANLSTGQSSTITVRIDPDGNLVDTTDQVDQAGFFTVDVDFANLKTVLEFFPSGGFPSGGRDDDPDQPGNQEVERLIVMNLPTSLLDLVGNQLSNPQQVVFRTELIEFSPIELPQADPDIPDDQPGEGFQTTKNEDADNSGGTWGDGRLTYGTGGASGRLGRLTVATGQIVTLDTDSQSFPLPGQVRNLLDNSIPVMDYDPADETTWPNATVDDGAFEFTSISIASTGRLEFTGSNVPRLFARGRLNVSSGATIDGAGESALAHVSNTGRQANMGQQSAFGGAGGAGGAGAGRGGSGGDRVDETGHTPTCENGMTMTDVGGIIIPNSPNNPGTDNDGENATGIGASSIGGGRGGLRWPPAFPRRISTTTTDPNMCNGSPEFIPLTNPTTMAVDCRCAMVAGPGGGGGYALPGEMGVPVSPYEGMPSQPGNLALTPPPTPGGDISGLGLESPDQPPMVRRLDYHQGNLRGGSGGGGGGTSMFASKTNASSMTCIGGTTAPSINPFFDHSGAGGGGGGGGLQLTAGKNLVVNGVVDASGGNGGAATAVNPSIFQCTNVQTMPDCQPFAAPGGGGSGGAVRLQSASVELALLPDRVDIAGGDGGLGAGGSMGGDGSPGLVRIEVPGVDESDLGEVGLLAAMFAPSVGPFMPGAGTEPGGFNYPFVSGAILSVGDWGFQRQRPDSISASMSCWMKPQGNFFELQFVADDTTDPTNPDAKGWNMDVIFATPSGEKNFPYRGTSQDPDFPLTGTDFESFLGQLINSELPAGQGSLVAVRFQGARASGNLIDPCNVLLSGLGAEIESGSLTPWVRHPEELNLFSPQPNMLRFCVVFEEALKSQGPVQFRVRGVTNLRVTVQPN